MPLQGEPFSRRLPLFHQLDLRVDKRWQFESWRFSTYLDVQNAYNNAAVEDIAYNYNFSKQTFTDRPSHDPQHRPPRRVLMAGALRACAVALVATLAAGCAPEFDKVSEIETLARARGAEGQAVRQGAGSDDVTP